MDQRSSVAVARERGSRLHEQARKVAQIPETSTWRVDELNSCKAPISTIRDAPLSGDMTERSAERLLYPGLGGRWIRPDHHPSVVAGRSQTRQHDSPLTSDQAPVRASLRPWPPPRPALIEPLRPGLHHASAFLTRGPHRRGHALLA